jgi:8-oxo-dGTP pyrophosphatase MutT (NUDIX family)
MNNVKIKKKVIGKDINKNKVELDVDKLIFRPSVYGILFEGDKILLSKQWDGWDFPGGGMDIHETIDEALEREFCEETGLTIKKKEIVACEHDFFLHPFSGKHYNQTLMYFLCEKISGELTTENFDKNEKKYADMPEWIDIKDVDKIKFFNPVDSVALIHKAFKMLKDN